MGLALFSTPSPFPPLFPLLVVVSCAVLVLAL